eukprot:222702_1
MKVTCCRAADDAQSISFHSNGDGNYSSIIRGIHHKPNSIDPTLHDEQLSILEIDITTKGNRNIVGCIKGRNYRNFMGESFLNRRERTDSWLNKIGNSKISNVNDTQTHTCNVEVEHVTRLLPPMPRVKQGT